MTETQRFALYLLVMAGVTYLLRLLPMLLIKGKIENKFLEKFLYYVPYTVLAAMTFPAVFYATTSVASAAFGVIVAITLAYFGRGLVTVAIGASAAVFVAELVLPYIPFL